MIEIKDTTGTVTIGVEYFESIIAELNQRRATMSALANILECTTVTSKSIINILRKEYRNV